MKRIRNISLTIIIMMIMVFTSLGAQTTPHQLWAMPLDIMGIYCYNMEIIGDNIFLMYVSGPYPNPQTLIQVNYTTGEVGWTRAGFIGNEVVHKKQLGVTSDNNLVTVDERHIAYKISAQDGSTIWTQDIFPSLHQEVPWWTIYTFPEYIAYLNVWMGWVCLDNATGNIIGNLGLGDDWVAPEWGGDIYSIDGYNIYICGMINDGTFNGNIRKETLTTNNGLINGVSLNWQCTIWDKVGRYIVSNNNKLYICTATIDFNTLNEATWWMQQLDLDTGEIFWEHYIGTAEEYQLEGMINNGSNILFYGSHTTSSGTVPILMNYDANGQLTWTFSPQLPPGTNGTYISARWHGNTLVLLSTVPSIRLSGISTGTNPVDDTTTPPIINSVYCYPNPFRDNTNIEFRQEKASEQTTIAIYNVKGQLVRTLAQQPFAVGEHTITWDSKDDAGQKVSPGIYFYKITSGRFSATKKVILLK